MSKAYVDAILIVPLPEEFEACLANFTNLQSVSSAGQLRLLGNPVGSNLSVLLVEQRDMGKLQMARAANEVLAEYDAGLIICVGIAGGLSKDVNIGDVCYTGMTVDFTENIKVTRSRGKTKYSLSPIQHRTLDQVAIAFRLSRIVPEFKQTFEDWQIARYGEATQLIPDEFDGKDGRREKIKGPQAREGIIACGMVSADPAYNEAILNSERRTLAIETESSALFEAARGYDVPVINVRGISDYAGADKTIFEHQTNNMARVIAARNAMSFVADQLRSPTMRSYFDDRRVCSNDRQPSLVPDGVDKNETLGQHLIDLSARFDERLRELSPAYELIQKGYRLPVPRVRIVDRTTGTVRSSLGSPQEIRDSLREHRVLVISVSQEYPDQSLSWAIAADLLGVEIDGRQLLPQVINADLLQRPRTGFAQLVDDDGTKYCRDRYARRVLIVDGFRFERQTKTDFLAEQIEAAADDVVIVLTRSDNNALAESRFLGRVSAAEARLCNASFSELSQFVRANFSLSSQASDVIAGRLNELFRQFRMTTHPAYFAGVSRNILEGMLKANRRADLIELAVMGYITYAVGEDAEKVTLSRRARETFLSQIAFELQVERRTLTEADLVQKAEQMAERHDYDIRPASFVSWFMEHGILHADEGRVGFTLTFVQSFLLARLLHVDEKSAISYFDIHSEDFDFQTFSLYAELGASADILQMVSKSLDESCAEFSKEDASWLAQGKITADLLSRQDRVERIRKRVEDAIDDVRTDRDVTADKQRLLDAVEKVREGAEHKRASIPTNHETAEAQALATWSVAANLLGSGAESMQADEKRSLSLKLVKLTAVIIEDWSRAAAKIDYPALRVDMESDPELLSMLSDGKERSHDDAVKMIAALVDLTEFMFKAEPFLVMCERLCTDAHDAVLAKSINEIGSGNELEEIIRTVWLSELDTDRGPRKLQNAVRAVQKSTLLRVLITYHLVARVFWQVPNKQDREKLLNLAQFSFDITGRKLALDGIEAQVEEKLDDRAR